MDDVKIRINYSYETDYGTFSDALYMTQSEYDAMTTQDLTALKEQRRDAWIAQRATPVTPPSYTAEELTTLIADVNAQQTYLDNLKAGYQAQLDAMQ